MALYQPAQARFVITTSIGLPYKVYNLRRTPRVAMLYSDPTGSGLAAPPAVLTGLDVSGDPVSFRCRPTLDQQAQVLRLLVPDGLGMVPGQAGLLCHHHDDQLWGLQSFLLRGTLEQTDQDWVFRPHQLVPGMDTTPLSNLRLLRNGRRTAKRYLAARGLRRPTIPWDHDKQLKDQARAEAEPR